MDQLEQILRQAIDSSTEGEWSIRNTSVVVVVEAVTSAHFDSAPEAFESAVRLVQSLLDSTGYALTNRADVGARNDPYLTETDTWRGTVDICLARVDDLETGEYDPITRPLAR